MDTPRDDCNPQLSCLDWCPERRKFDSQQVICAKRAMLRGQFFLRGAVTNDGRRRPRLDL